MDLRSKYGSWHGEDLREERRDWAREEAETLAGTKRAAAGALAKASMAELERRQLGETRRLGMREAGLGERLGREQEFARPGQVAGVEKAGAEAELRRAQAGEERRSTRFTRGRESTLEGILEARGRQAGYEAAEAGLSVSEAERDIRLRDEAEARTGAEAAKPAIPEPEVIPEPGRTINPLLKKLGRLSPPGAALYGYKNIGDWMGYGAKKGYEWAFPRTR